MITMLPADTTVSMSRTMANPMTNPMINAVGGMVTLGDSVMPVVLVVDTVGIFRVGISRDTQKM